MIQDDLTSGHTAIAVLQTSFSRSQSKVNFNLSSADILLSMLQEAKILRTA